MKKLLWIVLIMLLFSVCAQAEQADVPPGVEEAVSAALRLDWIPDHVTPVIIRSPASDTYWTTELRDADSGETVAVMRVEAQDPHRIVYYRLTDYDAPEWLRGDALSGFDLPIEDFMAWYDFSETWGDWADGVISACYGAEESRRPDLLFCADSDAVIFARCSLHGDLTAALICRLPETEGELPRVVAYADVKTDPSSGYDGWLTLQQAEKAGLDALRERFGEDAAGQLRTDSCLLVIYDQFLYIDMPDGITPDEWEADCSPLWVLTCFSSGEGSGWDDGGETCEYRVAVDAIDGNIVWICDEPSAGVG